MPAPRTESTRRAILDACRTVVEGSGSESWTMEDVADRAGVTRMTVYRYFQSRTHLLIDTVRHVDDIEQAETRFATVRESATAIEALNRWMDVWVDYIPEIHQLAQALLSTRHSDEAAANAWADRMTALRQGCRKVIERLQHDGRLVPSLTVDTATDLMWAIASVQVWDALTQDRCWSPEKYRREITAALRNILTDESHQSPDRPEYR